MDEPRPVAGRAPAADEEVISRRLPKKRRVQPPLLGDHPETQQLRKVIGQVGPSRATILVQGETGTGKELIAAAIHRASGREGDFVALNCAALSEGLLESELFGHEKGAFTGAQRQRTGKLEHAHGGTLFLDEVSEIPAALQVKLLRFLQEREIERVGGNESFEVDVRIVAATNRDLEARVRDGQFREDLFFRLNVVEIEVPPLRARPSDIPLLAQRFLERYREENGRAVERFSEAAMERLLGHAWPGNVRELQNAVERAVVLAESEEIEVAHLPPALRREPSGTNLALLVPGVTLAELERFAILRTLRAVGGSRSKAAEILGISRRTIQYRLKEWGIGGEGEEG